MASHEAKFCLDRNQVRWVLLEGVINRKTPQDDPDKGLNLPVSQIQSIEKTSIERRHKSMVAMPAAIIGLAIVLLSGWLYTLNRWLGAPGLVIGTIVFLWGATRISGTREQLDAFQLVAKGTTPDQWYIVGSHHEVIGFIEGLQKEMEQARLAKK
jgi:hypothetical protein